MNYPDFNTEEYLKSRIELFWKCRQHIINRMTSVKEQEEYKQKIQSIINTNLATYSDYKIEYCQYCYMPLKKDSVAYQYGHCGYSCQ